MNNKKLPVAVIVNTLNDAGREIDSVFQSILDNDPSQFIVVDGGSTDGTADIARKYTNEVYVVSPGIFDQHVFGLSKVKQEYVFIIETDHLLPVDCMKKLLAELENSPCACVQPFLLCLHKRNFFERGQSIFYELNQITNSYVSVPNAPAIWRTDQYADIIETMKSVVGSSCVAVDTFKADLLSSNNVKVWLSEVFAWQNEPLNLSIYTRKILRYGFGDYDYYSANKHNWSFGRKIKSLTHVFRKYIIGLPLTSIVRCKNLIFIPFSVLTAVIRYYCFFLAMYKSK